MRRIGCRPRMRIGLYLTFAEADADPNRAERIAAEHRQEYVIEPQLHHYMKYSNQIYEKLGEQKYMNICLRFFHQQHKFYNLKSELQVDTKICDLRRM